MKLANDEKINCQNTCCTVSSTEDEGTMLHVDLRSRPCKAKATPTNPDFTNRGGSRESQLTMEISHRDVCEVRLSFYGEREKEEERKKETVV